MCMVCVGDGGGRKNVDARCVKVVDVERGEDEWWRVVVRYEW